MPTITSNFNSFASVAHGGSTLGWVNTSNAQTQNNAGAEMNTGLSVPGQTYTLEYLRCLDLATEVPAGAIITAIAIKVRRHGTLDTGSAYVRDATIRLVKAGSIVGDNKASGSNWPTSFATATYGSDMWGTTWTAAEVNAADFGVVISVLAQGDGAANTGLPVVDHVFAEITYSSSGGGDPPGGDNQPGIHLLTNMQIIPKDGKRII